jgi:ABC-type Na+ efflux pump permease subunit
MVTVTLTTDEDDQRRCLRRVFCHPSNMVPLLGRTRITILGIIVIVLVNNICMEYSSMVAVEPDAVVQTTPTTMTTIKGGDGVDKKIIVDDGTDKKSSKIVAQEMGEREDGSELIPRDKNRTIQMISDNIQSWSSLSSSTFQQDAVLENEKNVSLPLPACLKARNNTIPRSMYGKLSFPVINLGERL